MTDSIIDQDTGWIDAIAPEGEENTEIRETLSGFDTPQAFLDDYNSAKNFDWRGAAAGDDDKFKSTLERFESLGTFGNAFREAQQTISSGQFKQPPGPDATEDQVKSYREANGIPVEAAGYLQDLPDGLIVGDDDKDIMADFMGALHSVHASRDVANKAIEWYNNFAEAQQAAMAEADAEHRTAADDEMRGEWGTDYRRNVNLVGALVEKIFGEGKDAVLSARDAEGRAIMNNPVVLRGLAELAVKELHPMSVPNQTVDPAQTVNDEIAELEKLMGDRNSDYWKGPNAEKNQKRLHDLYDIRLKHQAA